MNAFFSNISKSVVPIQSISSELSALFSFVMVIVTIIYVRATFKMVHSAQKAYLRPIIISENKKEIILKNLGSVLAIKVELYAEPDEGKKVTIQRGKDSELYIEEYLDFVYEIFKDNFVKASCESFDIQQNENCTFSFPVEISSESGFWIFWQSITGEKNYKLIKISITNGKVYIIEYSEYKKVSRIKNMLLLPRY
jgi:hypothetical protein